MSKKKRRRKGKGSKMTTHAAAANTAISKITSSNSMFAAGSWKTCSHVMDEFVLPNGTKVYPSANRDVDDRATLNECPSFGLYLDTCWVREVWWRNEFIQWRDFGLPRNLHVALEQIRYAWTLAKLGRTVEIACIGGHGRTGTVLACMMVLEGAKATDAIAYVRSKYCFHAIETDEQEWYVEWVEATIHGEAPPPQPQPKTWGSYSTGGSYAVGPSTARHTKADHWWDWVFGFTCTECSDTWNNDVSSFMTGWTPNEKGYIGLATDWIGRGEIAILNEHVTPFTMHRHNPLAKLGCKCDACRYLELGHGALLRPISTAPECQSWAAEIGRWQKRLSTKRITGETPDRQQVEQEPSPVMVKMATKDKGIMEVMCGATFAAKRPKYESLEGSIDGKYVYHNGEWVFDPQELLRDESPF